MDNLTYRKLVEAMRKNGYRKVRGSYFKYKNTDGRRGTWDSSRIYKDTALFGACAMGQAALNLDVDPNELIQGIDYKIRERIFSLNDRTGKTVPQIANIIEEEFASIMDKEISW